MPRKPKPALPELHIESLSTGLRPGLVDEFTGQPIAQPNAKPRKTSAEYAQSKVAVAQRVLTQAGWYTVPKSHKPFKRRF